MTIQDIRGAIELVGGQVVVTPATLASTPVTTLLSKYFPERTLTISPAAIVSKPDDDHVLVRGLIALLNVQVDGTVRFYMDAGDAQVEMNGTLPPDWHFGDSFKSLEKTYLAKFVLGSPAVRLVSTAPAGAMPGLTLNAGFTMPSILTPLQWFAAPDVNATLSGPIDLDDGEPSMTLTVNPAIKASLGGFLDVALTMRHRSILYAKPDGPRKVALVAVSQLACVISFKHDGKMVEVPVLASFNDTTTELHLRLGTAAAFDLALSEIAHWIGGINLANDGLPASYRPNIGLTLHDIDFAIGLQTKSLDYIAIAVRSTTSWPIIPDKIEIGGIRIDFMVMPRGSPKLAATIVGQLRLGQAATLDIYAQIPDFQVRGQLAEGSAVDLIPLIHYLGGVSAGAPDTLKIDVLSFSAHPAGDSYSFAIDVEGDWQIFKGLHVTEIGASIRYENKNVDLSFKGDFIVGGVDVSIAARYSSDLGGWRFTGSAGRDAPIKVGAFIAGLVGDFSPSVADKLPDFITTLEISHLGVSFDTATKNFTFECETTFTIEGTKLDLTLDIALTNNGGNYTQTYAGLLTIGEVRFGLLFEKTQSASEKFLASVQPEFKVGLRSLVTHISPDAAQLVPDLQLQLENALFLYEKTGADPSRYIFGLALGLDLDLASLPLVGSVFRDSNLGGIKDIQALYASAAVDADHVTALNALLDQLQTKPVLPLKPGATGTTTALTKGFNFAANITLGGNPVPVMAGGDTAPPAMLPPPKTPVPPSGNATWIDVKKSIGPVTLDRIGFRYESGRAWLMLDASFLMAGLSLGLQGLALGFKPDDLGDIAANLDGMSLSFQSGPLQIAGGFLRFGDDYLGEAIVKAASFGLTAIGGYSPANKSFFIFVRLNVPLGGPPFFFVTGLAGGFGINRTLILPSIDDLPSFILLPQNNKFPTNLDAKNPGGSLADTLASTVKYIHPQSGANWVAAGIDFTSFEMVDASALVTVAFGMELEIALLGICRVTVPKLDPEPIVYLEIALEARILPSQGLIAVDGRLTPASFLYAGLCRITGGFAFYIWFDGPHAGDFVVSIGGYHPRFKKPDNYPAVPRLQMVYQIGPLIIKGQAYFALTPNMLMAGIAIDATWSSGPLRAWFNAGMDFLLGWRPFHYEADAYIHIGVSLTLDLLFTSVTITIHVGVDLSIWGPPFGGKATIDLDIVSFTITFGDDPRTEVVDWPGFKKSFLPAGSHAAAAPPHRLAAAAATEESDGLLCTASVTDGLVQDIKTKQPTAFFSWIVDPNHFAITSSTLIPSKQATFNSFDLQSPFNEKTGLKYIGGGASPQPPTPIWDAVRYPGGLTWTDQLGVLPMKLTPDAFQTHHTVKLRKLSNNADYTVVANYNDEINNIAVQPVVKGSPSAMWGPSEAGLNGPRLVENTLIGIRLAPMIQHPDVTLAADLWAMMFDRSQKIEWQEERPSIDRADDFNSGISADGRTITFQLGGHPVSCSDFKLTALTGAATTETRGSLTGSLRDFGFDVDPGVIDIADLAQYPLWDWPMIRTLGEEIEAT